MTQNTLIRIENLELTFAGGRSVLRNVNAVIGAGDVVALIGSNGAGKTTLLRLIAGQIWPTRGRILIAGQDATNNRRHLMANVGTSLYPERSFYYRLTIEQNLRYFQGLNGQVGRSARTRRASLLELFELDHLSDRKFMELSLGQRARLGVARAMLDDPALLLLDEPFANLDVRGRQIITNITLERRARGKTTIFTTHSLVDVQHAVTITGQIENGMLTISAFGADANEQSIVTRIVQVEVFTLPGADPTKVLSRWRGDLSNGVFKLHVPAETKLSDVLANVEWAGFSANRIVDEPMGAKL